MWRKLAVTVAATVMLSTTTTPTTAAAQGVDIYIGRGDDQGYRDRRGCNPHRALRLASDYYGLRRATIDRMTSRSISIIGRSEAGKRKRIILANDRSCERIG